MFGLKAKEPHRLSRSKLSSKGGLITVSRIPRITQQRDGDAVRVRVEDTSRPGEIMFQACLQTFASTGLVDTPPLLAP